MDQIYPVKDGINHKEDCSQPEAYDRYEEKVGGRSISALKRWKECKECGRRMSMWPGCDFGDVFTESKYRRLERKMLKSLYTPEEIEVKKAARAKWIASGRQGHASGCTRLRSGKGLIEISHVAVAWSVRTTYKCPGCNGTVVEYD